MNYLSEQWIQSQVDEISHQKLRLDAAISQLDTTAKRSAEMQDDLREATIQISQFKAIVEAGIQSVDTEIKATSQRLAAWINELLADDAGPAAIVLQRIDDIEGAQLAQREALDEIRSLISDDHSQLAARFEHHCAEHNKLRAEHQALQNEHKDLLGEVKYLKEAVMRLQQATEDQGVVLGALEKAMPQLIGFVGWFKGAPMMERIRRRF